MKEKCEMRLEESHEREGGKRGGVLLCTLIRFNFSCSSDNQSPHGHPPAIAVSKGLCHIANEMHHITSGINKSIMSCRIS